MVVNLQANWGIVQKNISAEIFKNATTRQMWDSCFLMSATDPKKNLVTGALQNNK